MSDSCALNLSDTFMEAAYVADARTAFAVALEQLQLGFGHKILVPDFVCDTLLHPIRQRGLIAEFYPITQELAPDWDALEAMASTGAYRALIMIHYFGQPQDIEKYRALCARDGLYLVEDNAHGHGGNVGSRPLGTFGDVGFSSPRKIIGTPSGGVLYCANVRSDLVSALPRFPISTIKSFLKLALCSSEILSSRVRRQLHHAYDWDNPRLFAEQPRPNFGIDRYSRAIIKMVDWARIARRRREVWTAWSSFAVDNGMKTVFAAVHPESCPWAMPVYAGDQEQRNRWLNWGVKNRVPLFPWPPLPERIVAENGGAMARRRSMLCFPLDVAPDDLVLTPSG